MTSYVFQLSYFLLLVLVLSPQIQAREGKPFSFFSHFSAKYNVKAESRAPITTPIITAPTPAPAAPEQEPIIESGPGPEPEPEPEPEFVDSGEGYGLYGTDSTQYPPTKENNPTPSTTTFDNELLNQDFVGEKYETSYSNNNNEVERNNYNNQEYKSNYNNGYNKNYHVDSYSNSYNYKGNNGFERKREGMSDTRFMENGKYYYHVNADDNDNNYNLNSNNNGYYEESERGSIENGGGYYEKSQYPNEFDTMEEYEKQQGYTP